MERVFFEIDAALLGENASQALQQALEAHRAVSVPRLEFPMELDRPIAGARCAFIPRRSCA